LVAIGGPFKHAALVLAGTIEQVDGTLRQWPAAALSLVVLAILFVATLAAAG
jgi:ABC-type spermidine/putrescine transport system permease subunit I